MLVSRYEQLLQVTLRNKDYAIIHYSNLRSLLVHLGFLERILGRRFCLAIHVLKSSSTFEAMVECKNLLSATESTDNSDEQAGRKKLMNTYEVILYWSSKDESLINGECELLECTAHGDDYEVMCFWIERTQTLGRSKPSPWGEYSARMIF